MKELTEEQAKVAERYLKSKEPHPQQLFSKRLEVLLKKYKENK